MAISNEGPVETLEVLISNKDSAVQHLVYEVAGLGGFRREGGKWVPDVEDTPDQFDEMKVIDIDMNKASDLVAKWDSGEKLSEEDFKQYELPEEAE
jgi:hypothetical protein